MVLFALPIFFSNLFQQLYNAADSLIVGNYLGSEALAAVSSSGNLIFMMIGLFNGIALGAGVVIARYFGAQNYERLKIAIHTDIAFGFIMSAVLMAAGILLAPWILELMGTPDTVMPESLKYFRVYFAGGLGLVMYNIFVGILQALGDSKHPLYYLIISSLINIVLDYILIAWFGMGVEAAAFATILSQFVSAFLCMRLFHNSKESYRLVFRDIRIEKEMLMEILRNGIPSGIQNSITGVANVVVQSNINIFGAMAMAGCGAYSKIEGFAFLPIISFNNAITTFVGQNLGARQKERAKKGAVFGIVCSVLLAELIGIGTVIFAKPLIMLFDQNPEVIAFGVDRSQIAGFFFINSRIHPAILKRPAQLAMQYLLRQQDYTFLNYDSFLCATAILQIPIAEIARSIAEGRTTHVGELTEKDLSAILDLCRSSELFSRSEKQKFFYP